MMEGISVLVLQAVVLLNLASMSCFVLSFISDRINHEPFSNRSVYSLLAGIVTALWAVPLSCMAFGFTLLLVCYAIIFTILVIALALAIYNL